ncbi:MAG TPA: hypothetical protein VGE98_05170 [Thermoanaerobaculia bacterium]
MTNAYDEARSQRNLLERLVDKIPGFRGFQDRELRRDVDKQQREHVAAEIGRLKTALRDKTRAYTDAGHIGWLNGFDRLDRQLDGLAQSIRFSDYGNTGFFDPVKIGEPQLARLYEFDLSLLDDVATLERQVAAVPAPGNDDPTPALEQARELARALDDKWKRRREVLSATADTQAAPPVPAT